MNTLQASRELAMGPRTEEMDSSGNGHQKKGKDIGSTTHDLQQNSLRLDMEAYYKKDEGHKDRKMQPVSERNCET